MYRRLIPLASIVTPGTLSVQMSQFTSHSAAHVPYLNFTSLSFAAGLYADTDTTAFNNTIAYHWSGPSQSLQRIAAAVAAQGSPLPLKAPSPNSSFVHEFYGPSLKCTAIDNARVRRIQQSIVEYTTPDNCYQANTYLAWYGDLPFVKSVDNKTSIPSGTVFAPSNGASAAISLAIMPHMGDSFAMSTHRVWWACEDLLQPSVEPTSPKNPFGDRLANHSTYFDCQLFNTSYSVSFNYSNGEQSIDVETLRRDQDQPVNTIEWVNGPMPALWFKTGDAPACVWEGGELRDTFDFECSSSKFDARTVQALAYQGVMQAFTQLLQGSIASDPSGVSWIRNSSIMSTKLIYTKELAYLTDRRKQEQGSYDTLQWMLQNTSVGGYAASTENKKVRYLDRDLAQTMEEMFQQYTVSLLSDPTLQ